MMITPAKLIETALNASHPHEALNKIASGEDIVWCPTIGDGRLAVCRYEASKKILIDCENFSSAEVAKNFLKEMPENLQDKMKTMLDWPLYSDGPGAVKRKKILLKIFDNNFIKSINDDIVDIVDDVFSRIQTGDDIDIVHDIADVLPLRLFCEYMGLPIEDASHLKHLTDELQLMTEPSQSLETVSRIEFAWDQLVDLLSKRFQHPASSGTVMEKLVTLEIDGEPLKHDELIAEGISLLFGAHETTTSLITNAIYSLLTHPVELRKLVEDKSLVHRCIDETLRFDPPAKITARVAVNNYDYNGYMIHPGDKLIILLNAANRDPKQFVNPDKFDISREASRHLAFGHGPHFCIGAVLARNQVSSVLQALLSKVDLQKYKVLDAEWLPSQVFRKFSRLTIGCQS